MALMSSRCSRVPSFWCSKEAYNYRHNKVRVTADCWIDEAVYGIFICPTPFDLLSIQFPLLMIGENPFGSLGIIRQVGRFKVRRLFHIGTSLSPECPSIDEWLYGKVIKSFLTVSELAGTHPAQLNWNLRAIMHGEEFKQISLETQGQLNNA